MHNYYDNKIKQKVNFYIISLLRQLRVNLSFFFNKKNPINLSEKKFLDDIINIAIKFRPEKNPERLNTYNVFSKKILKIIFEKKLTNFLRFSFIQKTLFIHNRFFLALYLLKLLSDKFNWKKLLYDNDNTGAPIRYFLYPKTTGNLIFQIFHLKSFRDFLRGDCFDFDNIFEFGGGYGLMAKNFIKSNKKSKYYIFDLFELSLLQFYFLKKNNFDVRILDNFEKKNNQISLIFLYEIFNKVILNLPKNSKNLFIANWSVSEIPLNFRDEVIKTVTCIDYKFITFSNIFENIDNMEFFENLKKREMKQNRVCVIKKIDMHKDNYYFFTKPKK